MATIKPGNKVMIVLDVLDITTEDGPPNEDGVFLAKGALKLGYADDPTTDDYITSGLESVVPLPSATWEVARLIHEHGPALAAAVTMGVDAMHQWDGLHGNGPAADIEDAAAIERSRELLTRLAAALEGTDGNS